MQIKTNSSGKPRQERFTSCHLWYYIQSSFDLSRSTSNARNRIQMIRLVGVFLIAVLAFVLQRPSSADETYPTRPIRLIVGFAAGSSGDVAARIVSHKVGDLLGQTVIVENRPGASSMIATDYVARSAKDGYTLLFATIAATINTTLMPGKGANFEKDLAPIVLVGSIPNILVVNPDLGVNNVNELIALAKRNRMSCFMVHPASGVARIWRPNFSSRWRE